MRVAGFTSLGLLGVIGVLTICPVVQDNSAQAAEMFIVALRSTANISISVDPSVVMETTTMTDQGAFTTGNANLTIATNNTTGYQLFLTSANAGQTALVNSQNTAQSITSITANTIGSKMTGNVWGYTIGTTAATASSTFSPIPANTSAYIKNTNQASATNGDTYKLGFGAHIEKTLPTGTYTNNLIVSAVANYVPPEDISEISTMQEMNSTICSNMTQDQQYQLTDSRDSKTYYIAKLKDGKCWMTQNLAYETDDALNIGTTGGNTTTTMTMWKSGNTGNGHEHYGSYYAWERAKIVCPDGWYLPSSDEFTTLSKNLSSAVIQQAPYYFALSSRINFGNGNLMSAGSDGYYWTSSPTNTSGNAYTFYFTSVGGMGTGSSNSYYGESVRCVAN